MTNLKKGLMVWVRVAGYHFLGENGKGEIRETFGFMSSFARHVCHALGD